MRETCTSGSKRGEWIAHHWVVLSPTLPALGPTPIMAPWYQAGTTAEERKRRAPLRYSLAFIP